MVHEKNVKKKFKFPVVLPEAINERLENLRNSLGVPKGTMVRILICEAMDARDRSLAQRIGPVVEQEPPEFPSAVSA